MTNIERLTAIDIASAMYWQHIAQNAINAGEFDDAARAFNYACEYMHKAYTSDTRRYYETNQEHEIAPGLLEMLKFATERATKRLNEENQEDNNGIM